MSRQGHHCQRKRLSGTVTAQKAVTNIMQPKPSEAQQPQKAKTAYLTKEAVSFCLNILPEKDS
jgi:hypothetical protein